MTERGTSATVHGVAAPPTWASFREAVAVVTYPRHLRRSLAVAAIVGAILFAINQLDVVLAHHATPVVYLKSALTFLVPFLRVELRNPHRHPASSGNARLPALTS